MQSDPRSTYNPIVRVEELKGVWSRVSPRAAAPNTALVLTRDSGPPVLVNPSGRPPLGYYRYQYVVDMGEHRLRLACSLPCVDGAFAFQALISFSCRVIDPLRVVERNVFDAAAVVVPDLKAAMRRESRRFDKNSAGQAEDAINERMVHEIGRLSTEDGLAVSRWLVELTIDADEVRNMREKHNVGKSLEVHSIKFDHFNRLTVDGKAQLVAMHLAEHPEDAGALFTMLAEQEAEEHDRVVQALRVLLSPEAGDDDFHIEQGKREMVRRLWDRLGPENSSPAGRLSTSRIRGTLRAPEGGGRAIESAEPDVARPRPEAAAAVDRLERSASPGPEPDGAAVDRPGPGRPKRGAYLPRDPDAGERR